MNLKKDIVNFIMFLGLCISATSVFAGWQDWFSIAKKPKLQEVEFLSDSRATDLTKRAEHRRTFEAFHNKKPVGYIIYGLNDGQSIYNVSLFQKCYISMLEVDEPYRKQGIGSELLQKSLQDLRSSGCERINLVAAEKATNFWKKMGFASIKNSHMELSFTQPISQQKKSISALRALRHFISSE